MIFMRLIFPAKLISALLLLALAACSNKNVDFRTSDEDAQFLYERAYGMLNQANFEGSIAVFQLLESRYPFSPYALQAQLDMAYTQFLFGRAEQAVSEADRFIRFNPTHPNVDYAYYIKGVANFGQKKLFLGKLFPRTPENYDHHPLQDSFNNFAELIARFPNSIYAKDARQRMIFLANTLAKHELKIATFYISRKAWVAAVNRALYVLTHFPYSDSNDLALAILVEGYRELDLQDAARNAERVLKLNYPNHPLVAQSDGDKPVTKQPAISRID